MSVNLTVIAALAVGADPRDPNLNRIHDIVYKEEDCCQYQFQLVSGHIEPVKLLNPPTDLHFRCSSQDEGRFGSGRRRREG